MKKLSLFLACICLAAGVSGCTFGQRGGESSAPAASSSPSASASEEAAASERDSQTSPAAPSGTALSDAGGAEAPSREMAESAPESSAAESSTTEGLVRYDSIYDIPFADLEYENDRNSLSLNGEPWASAPGPSKLGDLCFTDGKILIIQCFYGDLTNFAWFAAPFDWKNEAPVFPEETYNKLFTRAEGYTLYTDDGYSYTVTP